jgi:hypothetical protein
MNQTRQWLFEAPIVESYSDRHLELEWEFPEYEHTPRSVRRAFENAVQTENWRSAYLNLNGLNMYEMLRALDDLPGIRLNLLWSNRLPFGSMVNMPRIDYAYKVVVNRSLPEPVGDLLITGQVKEAEKFVKERSCRPIDARMGLSANFIASIRSLVFRNAEDINLYYRSRSGLDFVDWFNKEIALQNHWKTIRIGTRSQNREMKERFNRIWNRIPEFFGTNSINLIQFVCLMSIIINETGGSLLPLSERVGNSIAYAFNKIPDRKSSYNGGGNKTAFDLFNDPDFIAAHGNLPLGDRLRNTVDERWKYDIYPIGYPTSPDPRVSGIILEADFFKFRGRGLIQTTFRVNYKSIINYIKNNAINHPVVKEYRQRWAKLPLDYIATTSTNRDWDRLFQQTDNIIPAIAIRLHSLGRGDSLNYLNLPLDAMILNGCQTGSIWNVGRRVSGGAKYASLFRQRVLQILQR